jgi:hypothetical protein
MKNTSILLVVLLLAIAVHAKLFDVKSLLGSTTTPRKETITKGEEATTAASSATTIEDNIKTLKHLRDLVETDIKFHHTSYDRLAYLVDTYGPRMWVCPSISPLLFVTKTQMIHYYYFPYGMIIQGWLNTRVSDKILGVNDPSG